MTIEANDQAGRALLGQVQSLVRAFAVLDELAKCDGLNLSCIAAKVKLPRSTVHRLLTTMEALRYVEFDRRSHVWSIGVQAFTVGAAFAQTRDLGQLGRSIMRSLMSEVHHTVNIAVPEGTGMCYVGQVAAKEIRRTVARPGACLPMYSTASGKAVLAQWDDESLERLLHSRRFAKRTDRSIVDPVAMREELSAIRQRGYAIDDEEHADGLRCVAAVIFDRYGAPKGALSISDSASRLDRQRLHDLGPTLSLAASQMTREIATQMGF